MTPTRLILVGGFLGAGKTTLLSQTARRFVQQGKRVGLITNDQAPDLVDTSALQQAGLSVEEIAGGCFCCKFDDLIAASGRLVDEIAADVLIAEPVGSCTDISATVLQPFKEIFAERFQLAPFSVLVDPFRLQEVLDPRMKSLLHPSARYILKKQLEEADIIVLNKIDLLTADELAELGAHAAERFPGTDVLHLSALRGDGVQEWLSLVLQDTPAGRRVTEVDYDTYAEGEAVLGWLNATLRLSAEEMVDWNTFCERLLQTLQREFQTIGSEVAHIKLLLSAAGGECMANLSRTGDAISIRGSISGNPQQAKLILNARVQISPKELRGVVETALRATAGSKIRVETDQVRCLSPARPQPTHRYAAVV